MGFEPMNTGFADQRVSHFATGAHEGFRVQGLGFRRRWLLNAGLWTLGPCYCGCAVVRR